VLINVQWKVHDGAKKLTIIDSHTGCPQLCQMLIDVRNSFNGLRGGGLRLTSAVREVWRGELFLLFVRSTACDVERRQSPPLAIGDDLWPPAV